MELVLVGTVKHQEPSIQISAFMAVACRFFLSFPLHVCFFLESTRDILKGPSATIAHPSYQTCTVSPSSSRTFTSTAAVALVPADEDAPSCSSLCTKSSLMVHGKASMA